jgi:hypothetical protein
MRGQHENVQLDLCIDTAIRISDSNDGPSECTRKVSEKPAALRLPKLPKLAVPKLLRPEKLPDRLPVKPLVVLLAALKTPVEFV